MREYIKLILLNLVIYYVAFNIQDIEVLEINLASEKIVNNLEINIVEAKMAEPKTNQDITWNYLKNKGLTDVQVAAIMGNIEQESRFITGAIESNGEGIGLIQWSFTRKANYLNFAKGKNDIYTQLEYLWHELTECNMWTSGYENIFYNSNSIEECTKAFCWGFERPSVKYANINYRIQMAKYYYNIYN